MTTNEWLIDDSGPVQEWGTGTIPAGHGEAIRRRRIAARLLDRLELLVFTPSIRWLHLARWLLCMAAVWFYASSWLHLASWRMDALIMLVAAGVVQLVIMEHKVMALLRREE